MRRNGAGVEKWKVVETGSKYSVFGLIVHMLSNATVTEERKLCSYYNNTVCWRGT